MKINLAPPKKARIEMLPLIDIVFLLLVVFIYAMLSMAVHRGLPVELPASKAAKADKKEALSITLQQKAAGQVLIFIDGEPVKLAQLTAVLQEKAEVFRNSQGREPVVQFFADKAVAYDRVFQVLDRIRLAGLGQVSLQADEVVEGP